MKYDNKNIKQSITEGLKKHYGIIPNFVDFKPVGEESYSYFVIDKDGEKYFVKYCEKANAIKNIDLVNQLLSVLKELHLSMSYQGKYMFIPLLREKYLLLVMKNLINL